MRRHITFILALCYLSMGGLARADEPTSQASDVGSAVGSEVHEANLSGGDPKAQSLHAADASRTDYPFWITCGVLTAVFLSLIGIIMDHFQQRRLDVVSRKIDEVGKQVELLNQMIVNLKKEFEQLKCASSQQAMTTRPTPFAGGTAVVAAPTPNPVRPDDTAVARKKLRESLKLPGSVNDGQLLEAALKMDSDLQLALNKSIDAFDLSRWSEMRLCIAKAFPAEWAMVPNEKAEFAEVTVLASKNTIAARSLAAIESVGSGERRQGITLKVVERGPRFYADINTITDFAAKAGVTSEDLSSLRVLISELTRRWLRSRSADERKDVLFEFVSHLFQLRRCCLQKSDDVMQTHARWDSVLAVVKPDLASLDTPARIGDYWDIILRDAAVKAHRADFPLQPEYGDGPAGEYWVVPPILPMRSNGPRVNSFLRDGAKASQAFQMVVLGLARPLSELNRLSDNGVQKLDEFLDTAERVHELIQHGDDTSKHRIRQVFVEKFWIPVFEFAERTPIPDAADARGRLQQAATDAAALLRLQCKRPQERRDLYDIQPDRKVTRPALHDGEENRVVCRGITAGA